MKKDIMIAVSPLHVCSGVESGCEAVIHAMKEILDESEVEGA